MYQHFADNEELKAKEKSWADIFKSKQDNPKPPHIKGLEK
jgi:hypothetical protein